MDNYKYAKAFERLAIKIVETQYEFQLDYERTHITQATRDYGIDSVIYFSDRTIQCATIEAKLRKNDYTLALKDIASSILFFLVRKGDEHFIVSNVYITSGTIDVINLLNLQSTAKLHYISGAETQNALKKIIENVTDSEERELACYLINNFETLKKPQYNENVFYTSSLQKTSEFITPTEMLPSRKSVYNRIIELIQQSFKYIVLRGEIGIGKKTIAQQLNQALALSNYKIITIDAFLCNTLDIFCCELTRKILGLDLQSVVNLLSSNDIELLKTNLNAAECELLDNIQTILGDKRLSDHSAIYLAKIYLNTLLKKCNQLKCIIVIENFSYTSNEIFELIRDLITELPFNIHILLLFTYKVADSFRDFSDQYKQLYVNLIAEIRVPRFLPKETEQYLKHSLPDINPNICNKIHEFTQGNPMLINKAICVLKNEKLINPITIARKLNAITILDEQTLKTAVLNDDFAIVFFFALYLNAFELEIKTWEKYQQRLSLTEVEFTAFQKRYFEQMQILKYNGKYYELEYSYMSSYIENLFENDESLVQKYAYQLNEKYLFEQLQALNKIKLLYYCNDSRVVAIYEENKSSWMYKSNINWNLQALKFVCKYFRYTHNENIEFMIQANKYYLKYLNIVPDYDFFEQDIISQVEKFKDLFDMNFQYIENSYQAEVADVLAEYYIYKYHFYRQQSKFEQALDCLKKLPTEIWFDFLLDMKKIKVLRFMALSYKSIGNRKNYEKILEDIFNKYKENSYAKFIYWANKAAKYYVSEPDIALGQLQKCEFVKFRQSCPDETNLLLWVSNDLGIVNFYNNNLGDAELIAKKIVERSEKLHDLENTARGYNILGAIALKNKQYIDAKTYFYNAMTYSLNETSEAFFHFAINYISIENHIDMPLTDLIFNYIKINRKRLLDIFRTQELKTCRWYISICAFNKYLLKYMPIRQKELENILGENRLLNSNSFLPNYIVQDYLIVLF